MDFESSSQSSSSSLHQQQQQQSMTIDTSSSSSLSSLADFSSTNSQFPNSLSLLTMQQQQQQQQHQPFAFDESNSYTVSNGSVGLSLKQQVMINQFMSITGCTYEQSLQLLASTAWQYQAALSVFFGEFAVVTNKSQSASTHAHGTGANANALSSNVSNNNYVHLNTFSTMCAPSNTPVTPPNLDFLEKAFSKLANSASSSSLSNCGGTTSGINQHVNSSNNSNINSANNQNSGNFSDSIQVANSVSAAATAVTVKLAPKPLNFNATSGGAKLTSMPIPINAQPMFSMNNFNNCN